MKTMNLFNLEPLGQRRAAKLRSSDWYVNHPISNGIIDWFLAERSGLGGVERQAEEIRRARLVSFWFVVCFKVITLRAVRSPRMFLGLCREFWWYNKLFLHYQRIAETPWAKTEPKFYSYQERLEFQEIPGTMPTFFLKDNFRPAPGGETWDLTYHTRRMWYGSSMARVLGKLTQV